MPTDNQTHAEKLAAFAALLQEQTLEHYRKTYPGTPENCLVQNCTVHVRPGKVYTKVDVGTSGKYMVDQAGTIFGIKGYGNVHKGHTYGTLDTTRLWNWSEYHATPYPISGTQP
jgi:hypothetical protein